MTWGRLMRGELAASVQAEVLAAARRAVPDPRIESHRFACERAGASLLTPASAAWPKTLRALEDPPATLYHRGNPALLACPQIAVVGARRASRRALDDAVWLVRELAAAGLTVTSGLALGIDGAAHRAALDCGGATVAVLGSGLDRIYPARHRALAARTAAEGLLLSEFLPGTPALPPLPAAQSTRKWSVAWRRGRRSQHPFRFDDHCTAGSSAGARVFACRQLRVMHAPAAICGCSARGCPVRDAGDVLGELGLENTPARRR